MARRHVPCSTWRSRGLVSAVTVLLVIGCVLAALSAIAQVRRASLISDLLDGDFSVVDDLDSADGFVGGTAVLFVVALVATGVVWIIWQFRYVTNRRAR